LGRPRSAEFSGFDPSHRFPPAAVQDDALVYAAQGGDRLAFASIVERHQAVVFGYLRARLLHSHDAEDLTQEVFLRCFTCWSRFDGTSEVRPWLLGIARNLLHEYVRRRQRRKETAWTEACLEMDAVRPPEAQPYEDYVDHLSGCINGLGDTAKQAIEMRYQSQLGVGEIGSKLRRSAGAAKLLMFRARQALKNCLLRKQPADEA
jgi:RNA polymerase sigma-70 factor (ECF subfamily)